jgi:CubicO group peptidase (beta-lactamase class C family)
MFMQSSRLAISQQRGTDFSQLESVVLGELSETNTPGAAMAIVSGDRIVFAKGFGVSNLETRLPVASDMLFRNGSVGKMLTAAVLVLLAEEGKLKIDEPIGKYVKGLSPKLSQLTAHQLLTHTAGLIDPNVTSGPYDETALADTVRSWKDDLFIFEPGQIFSYSNPGYSLAGLLIEEASGGPYSKVMTERLFKPLGMSRTTLDPTAAMTYPLSQGHAGNPESLKVFRPHYHYAAYSPAGYGYSSVLDLARFAIAFLNDGKIEGKQVLPRAVIAKLSTPFVPMHSSPNSFPVVDGKYGYGLMIHNLRGLNVVEHSGVVAGYGCRLLMVPSYRFAVIVMTNHTAVTLNKSIEKAMELILPLKPNQKADSKEWPAMTEAEISKYIGIFENNQSRVEIVVKDSKLLFRVSGTEFAMTRIGEHRFSIPRSNANEITFVMGAGGKAEYRHTGLRAWKRIRVNDK